METKRAGATAGKGDASGSDKRYSFRLLAEQPTGSGKISAEQAKLHAETEFEKYRIIQDRLYESDFDRFLMLEQNSEDN